MVTRHGLSNRALALWLLGVTAVVLYLGEVTDNLVRTVGLLAFLPALAAAICTVRQTAFTAVWTLAVVAGALFAHSPRELDDTVLTLVLTAAIGGLAVAGCRARIGREEELLRLRSTASAMQQRILRPLPQRTDRLLAEGVYEPVQEDKLVGGDIYDVADSAYGTRVLIGDVQGKGLAAIGVAFAVIGAFREAAHREPTLGGVVAALEAAVVRHNAYAAEEGESERFATALVLGFDGGDTAELVSCGHEAPYLLRPEHRPVAVPPAEAGLPLGLGGLGPPGPPAVGRFAFPADATLVLCTDGLTEARAADGTFFPLADRLAAARGLQPGRLAEHLLRQAQEYTAGHQHDDIAILTLRRP
ncbi:PP2C family protein-serine/threonine phosphatase [Kitasatospora sp. NPDC096147]|uniref:PP2C family protein-serine/threonine phosphatase n=1 Tax=Kitasatospora sp. NPDC096147 TaxID=3364093 RepID=UPI0038201DDB